MPVAITPSYGILAPTMRASSRSSFPRPYICRLMSFSLVICPSVWPFDHCEVIAFWTAALSRTTPLANDAPGL